MEKDTELEINDLFENDELVLIESVETDMLTQAKLKTIEIGFKNSDGDIEAVKTVASFFA